MNRLKGIILLVCFILIGCATTKQAKKVEPSGFLSPEIYAKMSKGDRENLEPAMRYAAKDVDFRKYNKIMLDPIVYFGGPKKKGEGIPPEDSQRILDYAFSKIHKAIEDSPYFEIATSPGPGTIRLQFAFVDLGQSNVTMGAISTYIPQVSLITMLATMASDKPAFTGQLGVEFKVTDSSTGKLLIAGIDKRYGGKKVGKGTDSWKDVFNIIDYYSEVIEYRLCKLHKRDDCVLPEL